MSAESESADVFDFLDAYLGDLERGQEQPLSHWLARFPRSQEAIAREWIALRHPRVDAARTSDREPDTGSTATPAGRMGPYRILRELGRGGQGTVFLAEDTRIARRVALKVLASRFDSISTEKRQRFRREAEVIARLEHPGLCTIHDAELEGDAPWIAMRYVEGRTLAECLADAKRANGAETFGLRFPPRDTLEIHGVLLLFERAARALHAAHEAGVVHRDVKPGNVIVALDGRPVLLDFGLARDEMSETGGLTQSGDVFGTPAYMSPEQLTLASSELDRRTDVYSLGVTLYEALTLEKPFDHAAKSALYRAIQSDPTPDPRRKNKALGEDVKVVLETALEKDRTRRYATALDLAEDLRRIREYEPIHARPASVTLKFSRWTRRHPALAVGTIGTILALAIGLAVTLDLLADERRANSFALGKHLAQRAESLSLEDPSVALALGIEGVELAENDLTRSSLFTALDACWLAQDVEAEGEAHSIVGIAASPGSELAAVAFDDGALSLVDFKTGEKRTLERQPKQCTAIAIDSSGTRLMTASAEGSAKIFDVRGGSLLCASPLGSPISSARLRPDGEAMLVVRQGGAVEVLDTHTCRVTFTLDTASGPLTSARFSSDGRWIVALREDAALAVFDGHDGARLGTLSPGGGATAFEFACGGSRDTLLVGCADGALHVFDVSTRAEIGPTLRFDAPPTGIVPSADGRHAVVLVNRGEEGWAYLCQLQGGKVQRLDGHRGRRVNAAAFSPDGTRVATASFDTTARIFDVASGRELRRFIAPVRELEVAWSPDGERLLTRTNSFYAYLWYARTRPDVFDLEGHTAAIVSACFAPDGATALTASEDGSARLWNVDSTAGAALATQIAVMKHAGPLMKAELSADGRTVLTVGSDFAACAWDARAGAPLRSMARHPAALLGAAIDPAGERFVTLCVDGLGRIWSTRREEPAIVLEGAEGVAASACFSPDGSLVAVSSRADEIRLHDARDGHLVRQLSFTRKEPKLSQEGGVAVLAFRPGSDEIVAACGDRRLRFYSVSTGAIARDEVFTFIMNGMVLSPDGASVLVRSRFGGSAVRQMPMAELDKLGKNMTPIKFPRSSHSDDVTSACYSPDSKFVLTTSMDRTARVWRALEGAPVARREGFASAVTCGSLQVHGGTLRAITGCADGRVCVWPVDPLPAARARRLRGLNKSQELREHDLALPLRYR